MWSPSVSSSSCCVLFGSDVMAVGRGRLCAVLSCLPATRWRGRFEACQTFRSPASLHCSSCGCGGRRHSTGARERLLPVHMTRLEFAVGLGPVSIETDAEAEMRMHLSRVAIRHRPKTTLRSLSCILCSAGCSIRGRIEVQWAIFILPVHRALACLTAH